MTPLATILTQIGLPALIRLVSESLGVSTSEAAKKASGALNDVLDALNTKTISPNQQLEINRHTERLVELLIQEKGSTLSEINKSLRKEVASKDAYVRRMRPTFGYLVAISWTAQMFSLSYILIYETEKAHLIISAMESLGTIWAVALSVLGVYVYKRSEDKKHNIEIAPAAKAKVRLYNE